VDEKLFGGIVVVIDDDVENKGSNVDKLIRQVRSSHCPVLTFSQLPSAKELKNLRAASFFVVDWNLHNPLTQDSDGLPIADIPAGLSSSHRMEILEFLRSLKRTKFSPIFIFTDADVDEVKKVLIEAEIISDSPNDHIFVMSKAKVVKKGLSKVLADWVKKVPSAYVLKKWESEYERAKNELFIDFYTNSPLWPLIFWKAFKDDGVIESHEMGAMIGRNLVSRISRFGLKMQPALTQYASELSAIDGDSRLMVKKVLEGERFIPKSRLPANSISTGDLFKKKGSYYLNIRPDCDCIARDGKSISSTKLYLLEGSKLSNPKEVALFDKRYGHFSEHGAQAIVFGVDGGRTVSFAMKDLLIQSWGTWKGKRIGRLVGPSLIGVQQKYSAYLQRPGFTRIPGEAIELTDASTA
jgi:hypothetical protein